MPEKEKDIVRKMDGVELIFTKLCKTYSDLGEDLKACSGVLFQQPDTIELGLWIMQIINDWDSDTGMQLYEYLAEELKKKFVMIDKPEVTHLDDCSCEQNPNEN